MGDVLKYSPPPEELFDSGVTRPTSKISGYSKRLLMGDAYVATGEKIEVFRLPEERPILDERLKTIGSGTEKVVVDLSPVAELQIMGSKMKVSERAY